MTNFEATQRIFKNTLTALRWEEKTAPDPAPYAEVIRLVIKARDAHLMKCAVRRVLKNSFPIILGTLFFIFLTCGIAEWVVLKLIGG